MTIWPKHKYRTSTLKGHPLYLVWWFSSKGVKKNISWIPIFQKLAVWISDLKINRSYLLSRKSQEIMSGQHLFKNLQFDFDFWPRNLKINRDHRNPTVIYCTKFSNIRADIERSSLDLQTDRPTVRPTDRCKAICAPFSEGGITNRLYDNKSKWRRIWLCFPLWKFLLL